MGVRSKSFVVPVVLLCLVATVCASGLAQKAAVPAASGAIDLQAERQLVTPVAKNWRFHGGDDPRWAEPGFDDSAWKVMQPLKDWTEQGCLTVNNLMWFRFSLKVPPNQASLVMLLPGVSTAYQVFADGQMIGQAGILPPAGTPETPTSAQRIFTLPVKDATRPLVVALRMWHDPRLTGISPDRLRGTAYVGSSKPVMTIFTQSKAANLLAHGDDYTEALLGLVVGGASLLLFLLTREGFYGWFAISMFLNTLNLPIRLASQHFAWEFFFTVYAYAALDFFAAATFVLFVVGALNLRFDRRVAILITLELLAEIGPIVYILGKSSLVWADGIYFLLNLAPDAVLAWWLIRSWRSGGTYAKFLLPPYLVAAALSACDNLGHWLVGLNVPHGSALLTSDVDVLTVPFQVTLNNVGAIVSTLGLLAVLVYRFARSSREEQRLTSALQTAHDIQHSLVPVDIPRLGGLHTEIVYLAAEEVGGDFCQVLPRADGSILIVIGDVSGKGLQAAMLGTLAVGALRSMADEEIGPAAALGRLNNVLLRTANKGFITCLCLNLLPSGRVIMANAGHLSPYLDGEEMPAAGGLPLGITADMEYEQTTFLLPETARLTLLSDGVVEARSQTGELFGFDRTAKASQLPAKEIAAEANRFGQEDDITIITLDWRMPVGVMA